MSISATRSQRRQLQRDNLKHPEVLREVPINEWPNLPGQAPVRVMRSCEYLVQAYAGTNVVRLSISRTDLDGERWKDNIPWEDLQRLKREFGYGDFDAVEVFPADKDVVNVANMRHLWVLAVPLSFAWRKVAA